MKAHPSGRDRQCESTSPEFHSLPRAITNPSCAYNRHTGHIELDGLRSPKISVSRANIHKIKRRESSKNKILQLRGVVTVHSHKIRSSYGKGGRFV
jgi:hypothetical protein